MTTSRYLDFHVTANIPTTLSSVEQRITTNDYIPRQNMYKNVEGVGIFKQLEIIKLKVETFSYVICNFYRLHSNFMCNVSYNIQSLTGVHYIVAQGGWRNKFWNI